jgi:Zn-dependent M28 family amino/carboxypeptidase
MCASTFPKGVYRMMEKPLRFVLIACLWLAACASLPTKKPTADVGLARADIVALGDIGPRLFGSQEEAEASQYIASRFKSLGYSPEVRVFLENYVSDVIAVKKGVSEDTIIVGAHYDSGAEGGTKGADDNASGVAVMLEVARMLRDVKTPYTIKFIAFDGHEARFIGSDYYVKQMTEAERAKTIVAVILDGLIAGDYAYVYGGDGEGGRIRDWLLGWAKEEGLPLQTQTGENPAYPAGTAPPVSDHVPFKEVGIPYVYFESTNWLLGEKDGWTPVDSHYGSDGKIWHTKYDNLAYFDSTFPGRVDERLRLFAMALYKICVEYRVPASSQ